MYFADMDHIEVAEQRKLNFELDLPRETQVKHTLEILHYLENADPKTQQEFGEIEQSLRAELKAISRAGLPRNEESAAAASSFMVENQQFHKMNKSTRAKADASEAQFSFPSHGADPKAPGDASLRVRSHHLMIRNGILYNTGTLL